MPTVEIVTFPSSEAFRKDPSVVFPVFDIVQENCPAGTYHGFYYGLQVEDGKTGYVVIPWETLEDHQKLIANPIYATLIEHVKNGVEGGGLDGLEMVHVPFEPASGLAGVLNGPFTSFVRIAQLKPGKTGEDVKKDVETLFTAKDVPGLTGAAYGKIIEKDAEFVLTTGWGKVEEHIAAGQTHPDIVSFLDKLKETAAERSVKHVDLKVYKKKYEA